MPCNKTLKSAIYRSECHNSTTLFYTIFFLIFGITSKIFQTYNYHEYIIYPLDNLSQKLILIFARFSVTL